MFFSFFLDDHLDVSIFFPLFALPFTNNVDILILVLS